MCAPLIPLRTSALLPHARLPQAHTPSSHHVGSSSLCPTGLLNVCPPHPVWPSAHYSSPPQLIFILRQGWLTCSHGFHTKLYNKGEERKRKGYRKGKRKKKKRNMHCFPILTQAFKVSNISPSISHLRKLWFRETSSLDQGLIAINVRSQHLDPSPRLYGPDSVFSTTLSLKRTLSKYV